MTVQATPPNGPQPIDGLKATVAQRAIGVLGTILAGMTDEAGNVIGRYDPTTVPPTNPTGVQMRHIYADTPPHYPEVLVSVDLDAMAAGMAQNKLDEDPVTGIAIYGTHAPNSTITLSVQALSDAQRTYLADALTAGLEFGYWRNPATGASVERVIQTWLGEAGIFYKGLDKPRYPRADAAAPRPEGEPFTADVLVRCDIWVTSAATPGATLVLNGVQVIVTDTYQNLLPATPPPLYPYAPSALTTYDPPAPA